MDIRDYIDFLSHGIQAAMLAEVHAAPKPGLVDRLGPGSHQDMTYETFLASIRALAPHFEGFMKTSALHPDDLVLPALRRPGIEAEAAMLAATGGINTHKGLIFSLGLISACLIRLFRRLNYPPLDEDLPELIRLIRYNTAGLSDELADNAQQSHGIRAYRSYGIKGLRQEAEDGFPVLFATGLPAIRRYRAVFSDPDLPLLMTLLELILVTSDTNLVTRGGPSGLAFMRREARRILDSAQALTEAQLLIQMRALDEAAIGRHLSPGGAADQLALSLFLETALDPTAL